jgi:hypothetical protein
MIRIVSDYARSLIEAGLDPRVAINPEWSFCIHTRQTDEPEMRAAIGSWIALTRFTTVLRVGYYLPFEKA